MKYDYSANVWLVLEWLRLKSLSNTFWNNEFLCDIYKPENVFVYTIINYFHKFYVLSLEETFPIFQFFDFIKFQSPSDG